MIIDRMNCQIKPTVSTPTLVIAAPMGSSVLSGANAGATIQPRMLIGTAAAAQIPRILARLYCPSVPTAFRDTFLVIFVLLLFVLGPNESYISNIAAR
jgi:L-asparagine transporter-like permease